MSRRDELVELGVVDLADRVLYLERRCARLELELAARDAAAAQCESAPKSPQTPLGLK